VEIFDSTLRDGSQGEGISFSVQDKINIVKALDEFGVSYIEAGNPGSNPKDLSFFAELKKIKLKNSKICAFGSTARCGIPVAEDKNIKSLLEADTTVVTIFGKSWDLHVDEILRISREDNLIIVKETVAYLVGLGKEVIFDAEHFFDGYRANPSYAMSVLAAAAEGGASTLCLCDTNGGSLPDFIGETVEKCAKQFPNLKIGIHCHDDTGCAVANSIFAVKAGAVQVQGTFVGFGERCGNADLGIIMANLEFKCGYDCGVDLRRLKETSQKIAEISNVNISSSRPYVGKSAFAHKGGMHIDGVMKLSASFEHIDPSLVGNERKFLLSEVSGRGTVLPRIQKYLPSLTKQSPETEMITEALKQREYEGYQYEGAEASFELFVKKQLGLWKPHFRVVMYKAIDDFPAPDGEQQSNAIVKIEVGGKTVMTCDSGNGPVNALDRAMRKAICVFYPEIEKMHLIDYKVRVINTVDATDARVRVLIESADIENNTVYTTIGVSNDIIEASFTALVDSLEYKLSSKEN
jgi:2-isopropylmalate synthase